MAKIVCGAESVRNKLGPRASKVLSVSLKFVQGVGRHGPRMKFS